MNDYSAAVTIKGNLCDITGQSSGTTIRCTVIGANTDANIKFHKSDNTDISETYLCLFDRKGKEIYFGLYKNFDIDDFTVRHYLDYDFEDVNVPKTNSFVVEYNIRSRTGQKAYSAVILPVKEFGKDFDEMIANKQYDEYYLEKNLEGERKNGVEVYYDRAWVVTTKSEQEFLKYLENNL